MTVIKNHLEYADMADVLLDKPLPHRRNREIQLLLDAGFPDRETALRADTIRRHYNRDMDPYAFPRTSHE